MTEAGAGADSFGDERVAFSITTTNLAASELERLRAADRTITILPERRAEDGTGVYGETTVFLAKDLRADGVDAAFLDDPDNRRFAVKHGVLLDSLLNLSLGIGGGVGSSAAWAGIQAMLKRSKAETEARPGVEPRPARPVELVITDTGPADAPKQYTFRGEPSDVAELIGKLRASGALGQIESAEPERTADDERS